MYFPLVHATRQILQNRLKTVIADHPYYGSGGNEPITVTARKGFGYKQLPAVLIHSPSGPEMPLDMGQFIEDLDSHVGLTQDAYFLHEVYEASENPLYPVAFADDTFTLTVTSQRTLDVYQLSEDTTTSYEFVENSLVDDCIPGVIIRFASFNNIVIGDEAIIKTYAEERYVGEIRGGRWDLSCGIDCLAQDVTQEEEITDLVLSILVTERDNFLYDGIQFRPSSLGGEADVPTDFGEEIYGHMIDLDFNLEWRTFVSRDIFTGWRLVVPVYPADAEYPTYVLTD